MQGAFKLLAREYTTYELKTWTEPSDKHFKDKKMTRSSKQSTKYDVSFQICHRNPGFESTWYFSINKNKEKKIVKGNC